MTPQSQHAPGGDRRPAAGRAAGVAAALCAVAIWAGWIPVTRMAVVTRLSPADIAALRFGTSALVLAPLLAARWRELPWRRPWPLLAMLVGAGVPYFLLFAQGLRLANSGQGAVLGPGATGVFGAALAWLAAGERPRGRRLTGLAVTAAGIAVVVLHDLAGGGGRSAGFGLILAASFGWAAYTAASRVLMLRPVVNAATVAVGNGLAFVPVYLVMGGAARLAAVPPAQLALQVFYGDPDGGGGADRLRVRDPPARRRGRGDADPSVRGPGLPQVRGPGRQRLRHLEARRDPACALPGKARLSPGNARAGRERRGPGRLHHRPQRRRQKRLRRAGVARGIREIRRGRRQPVGVRAG